MPVRRRRVPRKTKPRRKPVRRIPRSVGSTNDRGQMARIKETVEYQDLLPNLPYNFNFSLSQFARAMAVAINFKWYRASYVEWRIEPTFNTFQETSASQISIPYMYVTMNRTQDTTGLNLADIQAIGAKGQKLTTLKKISYKPNWCSPGLLSYSVNTATQDINAVNQNGLRAQYAYLPCPDNPVPINQVSGYTPAGLSLTSMSEVFANSAIYNGHSLWLDQEFTGGASKIARVTCTVHWEFKDPHYTQAPTTAVTVLPLATGNQSEGINPPSGSQPPTS